MVAIERRKRKGPILTPSSIPCLSRIPTINITEGCAHGCAYCYTQGYSGYPGTGRVVLYDNIPDLVQAELSRKRKRPRRVYFSPSSDAFQPLPEVLEVTYQTMSVILQNGVEVAFLTKGQVGERFLALFSRTPANVFAQIGVTTLCGQFWRIVEPGAASPSQRLETIEGLTEIGVATTARLDPLIPDVTDTDDSLVPLLGELKRHNICGIAASYVFLRPAFAQKFSRLLGPLSGSSSSTLNGPWQDLADGVGGGQMIRPEERRHRFDRLTALAERLGIALHVCTCKNPGLGTNAGCQIAGPAPQSSSPGEFPLLG